MEPWHRLNLAAQDEARAVLRTCCGSTRWVDGMLACRPFGSRDAMLAAAREKWFALTPEDWREAFSHHPKIGDRETLRRRFAPTPPRNTRAAGAPASTPPRNTRAAGAPAATRHLSEQEQAGVNAASEEVLTALADGNQVYEAKFGYIFIVCATGRSADEMLTMLRARLGNDPDTEIRIAAEEQAKITERRLLGL